MEQVPAVALPRRFHSLLGLLIVVASAAVLFTRSTITYSPANWSIPFINDDGQLFFTTYPEKKLDPLRIWLLESGGSHDEVTAALVHAFGGQKDAELRVFLKSQRYHMEQIISNFSLEAPIIPSDPPRTFTEAVQELPPPHVVVSATCEVDLRNAVAALGDLLALGNTYVFCVVHHPDRWGSGRHVDVAKRWVKQDKLEFLGLSQHTVNFLLNRTIPLWKLPMNITARVFPPVFPVTVPKRDMEDELSLAMQGDYSSSRRNYRLIFEQLGGIVQKVKASNGIDKNETVTLHVLGHGKPPEVPQAVRENVVFDQGLPYPEFYALLSRSFSIIPAFASRSYLDRKASSTIPASLIAGTPLVASEELLAAYSYLPREAAWVSDEDEGEMDVVERVIRDRDEYIQKRLLVRATCERLMEENRAHVRDWIEEALHTADDATTTGRNFVSKRSH